MAIIQVNQFWLTLSFVGAKFYCGACMPLLTATGTFGLGKDAKSSTRWCYLGIINTVKTEVVPVISKSTIRSTDWYTKQQDIFCHGNSGQRIQYCSILKHICTDRLNTDNQ